MAYSHFDTETCGFYGPICLLQYRRTEDRLFRLERGSHEGIVLYEPWHNPIGRTLEEFDALINSIVVGFNLTFDWFHVAQMYTTLLELRRDRGADAYPIDHIQQYADCEVLARTGPAIKPISAMDLMLHARKGPYQSMMEREDIRIKKIPRILGKDLANALDQKLQFKDIYFTRKKNKKERWTVKDITDSLGEIDPDFVDLVLSFAPSSGLKVLAQDALGYGDDISKFDDIGVDPAFQPDELGYAPYARAVTTGKDWTRVIEEHLLHWRHNKAAREYAMDDIVYTHELDQHFEYPEHGDDDSVLACMVGTVRWKGYRIDQVKMRRLIDANRSYQKSSVANFNSTQVCTTYLTQVLSPTELAVLTPNGKVTTGKIILEDLVKWSEEDVHEACMGSGCEQCDQGTIKKRGHHKCVMCLGRGTDILGANCRICAGAGSLVGDIPHPVAYRAKEILEYRHAGKEAELLEKLVHADRFHASLNVIGALSGRMSGADGLNAQGINRGKHVRECFPLADEDMQLTGGDFSGFEVCLADAVYGDPDLRKDLMTLRPCKVCVKVYKKNPSKCIIAPIQQMDGSFVDGPINKDCSECKGTGQESTKIHALFGQYLFPPMTYDDIYDTKGLPGEQDKYSRSKNGVFALLYGGEAYTLSTRVGVPENVANDAYQRWAGRYKVWGEARREIITRFCISGDTWVHTKEGPRKVVDLLYKDVTICVDGKESETKGFYESGIKEVYLVETVEGYSFEASADHPVLVNCFADLRHKEAGFKVWSEVKTLKIGTKICLANNTGSDWYGDGTRDDGYLLGLMYGDGVAYESRSRLMFYPPDFALIKPVMQMLPDDAMLTFVPQSGCYIITCKYLDSLVIDYGVDINKTVNCFIETASSDFCKGFLSGFFDSDGSVCPRTRHAYLHQSNEQKLKVVQRMLARFGIMSSVYPVKSSGDMILGRKCNIKQPYRLGLGGACATRFAEVIGFLHPDKSLRLDINIIKASKSKSGKLKTIYEATIKNVTSLGTKRVYDITVPKIEYFDANGIIAHNCSMAQPNGIGTQVIWKDPADYIETMFGFKRYFTLENRVCKALFEIADDPPKEWSKLKIKVMRREKVQTVGGAVRSALYGACFGIQAGNMRAAANHVIQGTGAGACKKLQRRIWDLQPSGVHLWLVQPVNIHDEIMTPTKPDVVPKILTLIDVYIEEMKKLVPLIAIDWGEKLNTWADK